MSETEPKDVRHVGVSAWSPNSILSRVLGNGARFSVAILAVGVAMVAISDTHGGQTLTPHQFLDKLRHGENAGIIGIGLLVLILTPVVREAVALVLFFRHGERAIVLSAALVLVMIALSLVIGAH